MNMISFIDDSIIKDKSSKMSISDLYIKPVALRINRYPSSS